MYTYRIWPDYTIQDADEPAYSWMSDDFNYVIADSEEAALAHYMEYFG